MKVAELFVKSLEKQGVEVIFGLPGEELEQILYYLEESKITFVTVRHEQAASFAAAGYGRVTGKPGVCISTLGPGATNMVTGVAEAQLDNFPVVAINSQQESNPHQQIDTVELFEPITKSTIRLKEPSEVEKKVAEAFRLARAHPQGVTHIEISEEFANISIDEHEKMEQGVSLGNDMQSVSEEELTHALNLLENAQKGLIIVGGLVSKNQHLQKEVLAFAKHFNIPLVTTFMGKGSISDTEQLSLLSVGLGASPVLYELFGLSNAIVTIGYDPVEGVTKFCNPNADIIEVNAFKPKNVDVCKPAVSLIGNVTESLNHLRKRGKNRVRFPEADQYRVSLESKIIADENDTYPFHPVGMLNALRKSISEHATIITDVGAHKMWVGSFYPVMKKETVIIPNGFASMGFALPAAIGAKIAQPDREVVCVCGDGGFLMNVQELETAVRMKLSMTIVVVVDETFSLIKAKYKNRGYDTDYTMHFENPDFGLLADSFGAQHISANEESSLHEVFTKALQLEGVKIVTIPIGEEVYDELFSS